MLRSKKAYRGVYGEEPEFTFFAECMKGHKLDVPVLERIEQKALIIED